MSDVQKILEDFRRAWSGDAFHGPAVRDILDGIPADAAFARPVAGAHSIAEIALHIATWEDIIRRRLAGEVIDAVPDDQDWLAAGSPAPGAWDAIRRKVAGAHTALEKAVEALPDTRLGDAVPAREYDVRYMLQGILQHSLYHAGQISLLKRAAGQGIR